MFTALDYRLSPASSLLRGTDWGDNGYIYLSMAGDGTEGVCAVLSGPSIPLKNANTLNPPVVAAPPPPPKAPGVQGLHTPPSPPPSPGTAALVRCPAGLLALSALVAVMLHWMAAGCHVL